MPKKADAQRDNETFEEWQKRIKKNKQRQQQRQQQRQEKKAQEEEQKAYNREKTNRHRQSKMSSNKQPKRELQGPKLLKEISEGKLKVTDSQLECFTKMTLAECGVLQEEAKVLQEEAKTKTAAEGKETMIAQEGVVKAQEGVLKTASVMTPAGVKTMKYLAQSSTKKKEISANDGSDDDDSDDENQNSSNHGRDLFGTRKSKKKGMVDGGSDDNSDDENQNSSNHGRDLFGARKSVRFIENDSSTTKFAFGANMPESLASVLQTVSDELAKEDLNLQQLSEVWTDCDNFESIASHIQSIWNSEATGNLTLFWKDNRNKLCLAVTVNENDWSETFDYDHPSVDDYTLSTILPKAGMNYEMFLAMDFLVNGDNKRIQLIISASDTSGFSNFYSEVAAVLADGEFPPGVVLTTVSLDGYASERLPMVCSLCILLRSYGRLID